jgi:hypothetical protein
VYSHRKIGDAAQDNPRPNPHKAATLNLSLVVPGIPFFSAWEKAVRVGGVIYFR